MLFSVCGQFGQNQLGQDNSARPFFPLFFGRVDQNINEFYWSTRPRSKRDMWIFWSTRPKEINFFFTFKLCNVLV